MAAERDVAAAMEARVLETFRRDGVIPPGLIRHVQLATTRRSGHIPTTDEVERFCREWMEKKLAVEAASRPVLTGRDSDEGIATAIDVLTGFSPRKRPKEWSEALAVVQEASQAGRLSRGQVAQLDALNAVYEAKAG